MHHSYHTEAPVTISLESGKTYTLFGEQNLIYERNKIDINQSIDPRGILARLAHKLFSDSALNEGVELKVSFYELYLEQIRDLTRDLPSRFMESRCNGERMDNSVYEKENLYLLDKGIRPAIKGLNEFIICCPEDICEIYESGVND